ncbi:TPA: response regulator [Vibrio parahaemolyticus]|nr:MULTISPECIES: response regulator [Vibrio]MBE4244917.1 response regulator [Vibrio parahaemolyticus]MDW2192994.1 response regulator [Vibrio sp. 1641]OUJ51015.1 two-component system response regulator [Vibrio parahaemolyticus]TOP13119.1 response regulator [Vibrio parahaemolyticus]HCE3682861.1 response regulator [Vibrio parahaemolyticus]
MTSPECKPVNILLVEDDDIDAMGIERALNTLKLLNPIYRARDGIEALECVRNGEIPPPCIVLLDLNMPRMNGLEFLGEVRRDDELCSLVIFVLTTSRRDEEITAAYEKNIAGYMVKSSVSQDFNEVLAFLDNYWRIVELPVQ